MFLRPAQGVRRVKTAFIILLKNYLHVLLCWINIDGAEVTVGETADPLVLVTIGFLTVHSQLKKKSPFHLRMSLMKQ